VDDEGRESPGQRVAEGMFVKIFQSIFSSMMFSVQVSLN
jgi:hypothetical protein